MQMQSCVCSKNRTEMQTRSTFIYCSYGLLSCVFLLFFLCALFMSCIWRRSNTKYNLDWIFSRCLHHLTTQRFRLIAADVLDTGFSFLLFVRACILSPVCALSFKWCTPGVDAWMEEHAVHPQRPKHRHQVSVTAPLQRCSWRELLLFEFTSVLGSIWDSACVDTCVVIWYLADRGPENVFRTQFGRKLRNIGGAIFE